MSDVVKMPSLVEEERVKLAEDRGAIMCQLKMLMKKNPEIISEFLSTALALSDAFIDKGYKQGARRKRKN